MKKSTVIKKLDERLQEASETYPIASDWPYALSLWRAIDKYYSDTKDVSEGFTALVEGAYCFAQRERVVFSDDNELGITHDYSVPQFSDVFYKWEWLDRPLVIAVETDAETGESGVATEQPALDEIIAEIESARDKEVALLEAEKEKFWADESRLKKLTEERGAVIATPKKAELVNLVYIDGGAKHLIEDNGLDVYIPRAVR